MQTLTIPNKTTRSGNIMDRVKSFEDACEVLSISTTTLNVSGDLEDDFKSISAYAKLIIIVRALNEGWKPDWKDENQYKYYPWFDMSSGSGLSCFDCDVRTSDSTVGSRLCFKSSELAIYAGKQFLKEYTDFFII